MTTEVLPPLPVPDVVSQPFWDAARDGRLVIQRCRRTGRFQHPPQVLCLCCAEPDLHFEPVSGRGTVHSFVVMHDPRVRGFEHRVPYVNLWVELEEQPFLVLVANLVESGPETIDIGTPVEVVFERLTDEITLPQFRVGRGTP
jgi:uncharacterized OB-fold protein